MDQVKCILVDDFGHNDLKYLLCAEESQSSQKFREFLYKLRKQVISQFKQSQEFSGTQRNALLTAKIKTTEESKLRSLYQLYFDQKIESSTRLSDSRF